MLIFQLKSNLVQREQPSYNKTGKYFPNHFCRKVRFKFHIKSFIRNVQCTWCFTIPKNLQPSMKIMRISQKNASVLYMRRCLMLAFVIYKVVERTCDFNMENIVVVYLLSNGYLESFYTQQFSQN